MLDLKGHGRAAGVLLLLQMATGLILPFVLIRPINVGSPGYLVPGIEDAVRVRASVLVGYAGAVLCVAIAALIFPVIWRRIRSLAIALLAACTISATLDAVQNSHVMSMISMAKFASTLPPGETAHFAAANVVYSARVAAHYAQLVGFGAWLIVFYIAMFRCRLIPRPIALLGIVGVSLQFSGVTLSHYVAYPMQGWLAMPLAPIHTLTSVWLIARGFRVEQE